MTLKLSVLIEADGSDAKTELKAVGKEAATTTGAVKGMGTETQKTSTSTKGLGDSASNAKDKLGGLSDTEKQAADNAKKLGNANSKAAGQTANLVAQGNDVAVMLMAGQNPMQLAMQQGTQITQVVGPMGAAGAFKALGSAVANMLSPMNFFIIGGLAAMSATVNWFRESRDAGKSFDETLNDVEASFAKYLDLMSGRESGGANHFENQTRNIKQTSQAYSDLIALSKVDTFKEITSLNRSLSDSVQGASWLKGKVADTGDLLEIETQLQGHIGAWKDNREQVNLFIDDLNELANAGSLEDQYSAAIRLRDLFKSTIDVTGEMTDFQTEFWRNLSQSIYQMELLGAATDTVASGYEQYYQSRIASEEQLATLRAEELATQASIYEAYANDRIVSDKAAGNAETELARLHDRAALLTVIAEHGADSVEAVELRVAAEREAYGAATLTADMSESTKDELMSAWDAAYGLASVDMSSGLSSAADQATRIANELARAVDNAINLAAQGVGSEERARINYEFREDPIARAGALARAEFDAKTNLPEGADSTVTNVVEQRRREVVKAAVSAATYAEKLKAWNKEQTETNRSTKSGAKATNAQRKAVTDLISGLRDELAILRELDPVKQEMLRNREAMAGATAAERVTISDLISTRNEETAALEHQAQTWDEMRSVSYSFFEDLRQSGGDLETVLDNLSNKIGDMVFQAALLGEGPLAKFFGTDGGGLIDTALTSMFPDIAPQTANAKQGSINGGAEQRNSGANIFQAMFGMGQSTPENEASVAESEMAKFAQTASHATSELGDLGGGFGSFGSMLSGLFSGRGGGSGGGLFSNLFGSLFGGQTLPALAEGGMVRGEGGPRQDSVLMWGSNGEFMMNAQATAKNRHLLELLNSGGSLPAFASGGAIGGGSFSGGAMAPKINIQHINSSSVPLDMHVEEETDERGNRSVKLVSADMTAAGMSVRGGKAQKTMRSTFGTKPRGRARL